MTYALIKNILIIDLDMILFNIMLREAKSTFLFPYSIMTYIMLEYSQKHKALKFPRTYCMHFLSYILHIDVIHIMIEHKINTSIANNLMQELSISLHNYSQDFQSLAIHSLVSVKVSISWQQSQYGMATFNTLHCLPDKVHLPDYNRKDFSTNIKSSFWNLNCKPKPYQNFYIC